MVIDIICPDPTFFPYQIEEVATFLAHQLPGSDNDKQAWLQSVRESITVPANVTEEGDSATTQVEVLSQEKKDVVVEKLVKTTEDVNGGLEASERGESVSFRLLKAFTQLDLIGNRCRVDSSCLPVALDLRLQRRAAIPTCG